MLYRSLLAILLTLVVLLPSVQTQAQQTPTFLEPFNGNPSGPQPWTPSNWDVQVHSRDAGTWTSLEAMTGVDAELGVAIQTGQTIYFDKRRYIIDIKGSKGSINTDKLRGMVVLFIVRPFDPETIWDLTVLDKDGDEMIELKDQQGRFEDKSGVALGTDYQESVTIKFTNVTTNKPIKVIFKTKEI